MTTAKEMKKTTAIIAMTMSVEWNHTQVKGQPHWRRQGPAKGLAPRLKGMGERDEVFIVLFDYSGVVMMRR